MTELSTDGDDIARFNGRLKRGRVRDRKSLKRDLRRFKAPVQGAHVVGLR